MNVTLRPLGNADVDASARIVHGAFTDIAERHGFPPSFPTIEVATRVVRFFLDTPVIAGFGAETAGRLAGAIFLDEGDEIRAVASRTRAQANAPGPRPSRLPGASPR
jgi:hypothetical protein